MRRLPVLVVAVVAFLVAACGFLGDAARPGVSSAAEAMAAVRGRNPLFDGIGPLDPGRVGASAWWEGSALDAASGGGWRLQVTVGWGDCESGCIDRHVWTYDVRGDGRVELAGEAGTPLTDDVVAARLAAAAGTGVGGRVRAGPVCPVVRPGDATCADRPVVGAVLTVRRGGSDVATFTTDATGLYRIPLAPGDYELVAAPAEGTMGGPEPAPFTVTDGRLTALDVAYDTGIR